MDTVWWFTGTGLIFVASVICMRVRYMFPVSVNCWFCNQNTKVVCGRRNSWHCPHCEQYNGFDQDGGYNKVLEEQHAMNSNGKIYNFSRSSSNIQINNGLCKMCNLNQQLKIQQLAQFVPVREENYDEEIEQYRQLLEKSYHLCGKCKKVVEKALKRQQCDLNLPSDLNFVKHVPVKITVTENLPIPKEIVKSSLRVVSKLIAVWLAVVFVCRNGEDYGMWTVCQSILASQKFVRELSGLGFLSYYLSTCCGGGHSRSGVDGVHLILWLLLHIFAWSTWTSLRSAACLTLLLFTFSVKLFAVREPRRILPEKSKQEVGESSCDFIDNGQTSNYEPTEKEESFGKRRRIEETEIGTDKKITPEKCWEFRPMDSKQNFKNNVRTDFEGFFSSPVTGEFPETKPGVFCEKINSDMINLNLGTTKEKCKKSANFLFQTHNFDDKKKDVFPLLRPAKFFSGTPNVLLSSEYEESCSRSSTPLSYPGRKCERFDSKNLNHYTERLPPSKSAFPVQRTDFLNRFNNFDYNPNNFYSWPDPVYTCGMQANFSFPSSGYVCDTVCPPCPANQNRLSETLETNSPTNGKPVTKSVFYGFSLFFNAVTLFFLIYRLWPELIMYDFKLPIFNFYL